MYGSLTNVRQAADVIQGRIRLLEAERDERNRQYQERREEYEREKQRRELERRLREEVSFDYHMCSHDCHLLFLMISFSATSTGIRRT